MGGDRVTASIDYSLIHLYSLRLAYLTQVLKNAQAFSGREGSNEEPWGERFQRDAAQEYERQLPRHYLESRCKSFRACQDEMERARPVPAAMTEDWSIVESYLRNLSAALEDRLDVVRQSDRGVVAGEPPTTPAVVHFEVLAPSVSAGGLDKQFRAADAVADFCLKQQYGGVTEEEISWLRALAQERAVVEIATAHGYSERSLHRRLKDLWSKMGVAGKTEAIVVAASVGWLSRPDIPPSLVPNVHREGSSPPT